ncbi:MAG: acyltransferase family protein, partial [Tepidisphaeraceae bacterium]
MSTGVVPSALTGSASGLLTATERYQAQYVPRRVAPAPHVPALDAVRGVAILSVMVFHFAAEAADGSAVANAFLRVSVLGRCGVDLFFVLSGFLITGILYDTRDSERYFRTFYARRILRIFPLYYGTIAVLAVFVPFVLRMDIAEHRPFVANQHWLWLYLTNFAQAFGHPEAMGRLGHLWSLAIEEHFYLAWPLVIFFFNRESAIRACGGMILLSLALRVWLM